MDDEATCTDFFEIVIVGGGISGTTAALALRSRPGNIALIETRAITALTNAPALPAPPMPLRAIALSDASRRILDSLGMWTAIKPYMCPVKTMHVSQKGTFGVTRIRSEEKELNTLGCVVGMSDLMRMMHAALPTLPNLTIFSPVAVQAAVTQGDFMEITLSPTGPIPPHTPPTPAKLRARLLILADGGKSGLAEKLGFRFRTRNYHQTAVVCNITTESRKDRVAIERFTRHGPLAVLPRGGRHRTAVWIHPTRDAQQLMQLPEEAFVARLQEDLGRRLGAILDSRERCTYPLEQRRAIPMVKRRTVLLGDTAHTVHPVAGQGFNLTLRDVAFLSEILPPTSDPGTSKVLANYEKARRGDIARVIRFTDVLARGFVLPGRGTALARGAGLALFDLLPPLRRAVVRRGLGLSPPWSRAACGLPLDPRSD